MTNFYYYDNDNQKQGPATSEQLRLLAKQGTITQETIIENESGKSTPAKNVKGLVFLESMSQEVSQESVNNEPKQPVAGDMPVPLESEQDEIPKPTDAPIRDIEEQQGTLESPTKSEEPMAKQALSDMDTIISELKSILAPINEGIETQLKEVDFWKQLVNRNQEQIERLHEENRAYRDGIIEQFKRRIVLGVIEQLDAAYKQIRTFEEKGESEKTYKNLVEAFREVADDFRDMLRNRLYISFFESVEGEKFDPARHNALNQIPTGDQKKDKTISRTKRYGYVDNDNKVLRPALVEVYFYDESLATHQDKAVVLAVGDGAQVTAGVEETSVTEEIQKETLFLDNPTNPDGSNTADQENNSL